MVGPEQVDAVGVEAFQARFHRRHHGLAAIAGHQAVGIGHGAIGVLGGQQEILAPALQQRAQQFLGLAELVDVCRVDEVAASVGVGVEDGGTGVGIGAMAPAGTKIGRAEGDLGNHQAGRAECAVFHHALQSMRSGIYMMIVIIMHVNGFYDDRHE